MNSKGFTLFEVLVATVVIGIALILIFQAISMSSVMIAVSRDRLFELMISQNEGFNWLGRN